MTVGASSRCLQDGAPHAVVVPARIAGTIAERLLAVLAGARDEHGDIARTLGDLAAAVGTSPRQVRRSAADLVAAGVVEVVRPAQSTGRYTPKVYRLVERQSQTRALHGVTRTGQGVTYPSAVQGSTAAGAPTEGRDAQ